MIVDNSFRVPGRRERRTDWVRGGRYVVAVSLEVVYPDGGPGEACYEPWAMKLMDDVRDHAERGDLEWLKRHGTVYVAVSDVA